MEARTIANPSYNVSMNESDYNGNLTYTPDKDDKTKKPVESKIITTGFSNMDAVITQIT